MEEKYPKNPRSYPARPMCLVKDPSKKTFILKLLE